MSNSSYSNYDFKESIADIPHDDIKAVLAAWGNVDSEGACCEECGGEWSGGFLVEMKDGRFAYSTGWCDYTGWGCQDGHNTTYYDRRPALSELEKFPESSWDIDPADLNLVLTTPPSRIGIGTHDHTSRRR